MEIIQNFVILYIKDPACLYYLQISLDLLIFKKIGTIWGIPP